MRFPFSHLFKRASTTSLHHYPTSDAIVNENRRAPFREVLVEPVDIESMAPAERQKCETLIALLRIIDEETIASVFIASLSAIAAHGYRLQADPRVLNARIDRANEPFHTL